jgi:hypothetical protein
MMRHERDAARFLSCQPKHDFKNIDRLTIFSKMTDFATAQQQRSTTRSARISSHTIIKAKKKKK